MSGLGTGNMYGYPPQDDYMQAAAAAASQHMYHQQRQHDAMPDVSSGSGRSLLNPNAAFGAGGYASAPSTPMSAPHQMAQQQQQQQSFPWSSSGGPGGGISKVPSNSSDDGRYSSNSAASLSGFGAWMPGGGLSESDRRVDDASAAMSLGLGLSIDLGSVDGGSSRLSGIDGLYRSSSGSEQTSGSRLRPATETSPAINQAGRGVAQSSRLHQIVSPSGSSSGIADYSQGPWNSLGDAAGTSKQTRSPGMQPKSAPASSFGSSGSDLDDVYQLKELRVSSAEFNPNAAPWPPGGR